MTKEEAILILEEEAEFLYGAPLPGDAPYNKTAFDMAIEALSVDAVKCKDCIHAYYADNRVPHHRTWVCERFMNEEITADDFCSWGERKEV